MKITIVGTGYQGLVVGTCLAENGHQVTCVDKDAARIEALRKGKPPIHEPGLEELINRNLEEERLSFSADLNEAVPGALMVFLCVGPETREDGSGDPARILAAVEQIAKAMTGYCIVVTKSTCPPGTAEELGKILKTHAKHPSDLVVNPDFLKEGSAIDDFMRPDRIVVGCDDVRVREIMKELYSPFLRTGKPFLTMSMRSAEMTKYATNVMLASRISLMNQLADICAAHGADIAEVREGVGSDDRIGPTFLFPGIGFGGAGLPRDLATCIRLAKSHDIKADIIEAIAAENVRRRELFLERILTFYGDTIKGSRIAVWGVSFKPRTDDLRGAPGLFLIDGLLEAGAEVVAFDPVSIPKLRQRYGKKIALASKYYQALDGADGLVIVTEWNEFRRPDYERMGGLMKQRVIFDGRNLYTPKVLAEHGFKYYSVGRPSIE